MKTSKVAIMAVVSGALAFSGCASKRDGRIVNTRQPGPAIGTGVGMAAGAVVGNAAGAVVGAGEGFVGAASTAFDGDRRVVRSWRTEVTPDGRTIRVPIEIEVDQYGRPYASPVGSSSNGASAAGPSIEHGPHQ